MNDFAVYYIEGNVICILVFGILLFHNHFNIDRQERQIKFDHVLVAFMLYFFTDCFWAAIMEEIIPKNRFNVVVNTFLIYLFMGATIYYWLEYVLSYEEVPHRNRPINRFAVLFPFLVSTLALVIQYLAAPQTLIDDTQNTQPGFAVYLTVVPDIYVAAVLFYTIRKARQEESLTVKRKHLFIGFFPLLVSVGRLVETLFFPHIPIYCFTCLILMLVFYIQSIMGQVSLDPLTGLNNRGQLTRYASQKSILFQEGRQTYVVMMDVDNFKGINDTRGHAEGDKALVTIAETLKKVVNSRNLPSFLARYGGDEFILIAHMGAENGQSRGAEDGAAQEIEQLIAHLQEEVDKHGLSISAGYDKLMGESDSLDLCIERADKKLYLNKEYRKRRRAGA
ncbi:MAG: GGDEF domain-containing protein [Clostridia bacterium]|nr:GGDEF domain-containing protein [Clostridia bacterium]